MASDRTRRRAWTLGVAATIVVTILYLTVGVMSGLRSVANLVVAPFAWTIDQVARPIGHFFAGTINYSDVLAQNQKLRYELGRAQLALNERWPLYRELQQVTTQLHVPFLSTLPVVSAQVTSISPTSFSATIDISKGRDNGVLSGMPVVANGGLVGSVIATTPYGATVRLITDASSLVGVTWGNGATSFVISGRGVNNGLGASSVVLTTSLKRGTMLVTNGLSGGLFPPGIPVARVRQVALSPGATTYSLSLEPAANLTHLSYVDVVQWEPST